jgi:hypothetical protein
MVREFNQDLKIPKENLQSVLTNPPVAHLPNISTANSFSELLPKDIQKKVIFLIKCKMRCMKRLEVCQIVWII